MSLACRSLTTSALAAGLILVTASGCKSGGGWWSPSSSKWGSAESSTSDLAVSRPTTRVPTPSSSASPTASGGLASRGAAGAQDGPYGSAAGNAASGRSGYGNQPAGWQGEPHSPVAPAGGYQTGGPYNMSSRPEGDPSGARPQPGVTPGAYAQPYDQGASADHRVADERGQAYQQPAASAGAYGGAEVAGDNAAAVDASGASVYQDQNQPGAYAAPDSAAGYGAPPPSDAPGAISEPTGPAIDTPLYGDSEPMYGSPNSANPAAAAQPAATQEVIANPYSLPASPRPPTSQAPTTSPATGAAPFTPPTLPSSLSGTPGSYRPGSTAAPGSGVQSTVYEPASTASGGSGTGYSTVDGTMMR